MKVRRRRRFRTLYADPPWPERGGGQIKRGADKHYPLMRAADIALIDTAQWMRPDSHCYLWVTNNHLTDGLDVLALWGYRYVTMVTWMKDRPGLGQYFRGKTEHCLFGVKGRLAYRYLPSGRRAQGVTGFSAPRGEHSVKPAEMRAMIERVSPGPYLELFARRPVPGWTVWGNEVEYAAL